MRVLLTVLAVLLAPLATLAQPLSVQEALLRATPAVALVIVEDRAARVDLPAVGRPHRHEM